MCSSISAKEMQKSILNQFLSKMKVDDGKHMLCLLEMLISEEMFR